MQRDAAPQDYTQQVKTAIGLCLEDTGLTLTLPTTVWTRKTNIWIRPLLCPCIYKRHRTTQTVHLRSRHEDGHRTVPHGYNHVSTRRKTGRYTDQ